MVVDAKDLEKLLTSLLRPVAFRREGRNWRLDLSDVIQVVNLQRSRWSDSFYLNIGIFVRAVQNEPGRVRSEAKPNIVECHFRIRLEDLFTGPPVPPTKISAEQIRLHELLNDAGYDTEKKTCTSEQYSRVHSCCQYREQEKH